MKWQFWKKEARFDALLTGSPPGPLPSSLSVHLVDELKLGCDWVRSLNCVSCAVPGQPHLVAFRIYSPFQTSRMGVDVVDHASLDGYPHLILFSGTINTKSGRIDLMPVRGGSYDPQPSAD